jgi:hypothetical protein
MQEVRQVYDFRRNKFKKIKLMEIVNFKRSDGKFDLATFDIDFGIKWGMKLCKMKLKKSMNGHYYVSPSSYKDGEMNGKANWKPYVEFYGDKGREFSASVLEALKPFIDNMNELCPDDIDLPF